MYIIKRIIVYRRNRPFVELQLRFLAIFGDEHPIHCELQFEDEHDRRQASYRTGTRIKRRRSRTKRKTIGERSRP